MCEENFHKKFSNGLHEGIIKNQKSKVKTKNYRVLILISILFLTYSIGYCEEINLDNETKEMCNQAVRNIYNNILKIKDRYKELETFDNSVLGKSGRYGLDSISY